MTDRQPTQWRNLSPAQLQEQYDATMFELDRAPHSEKWIQREALAQMRIEAKRRGITLR
jgi:hypothetical protein